MKMLKNNYKKIRDIENGNTPLYLACNFINLEILNCRIKMNLLITTSKI